MSPLSSTLVMRYVWQAPPPLMKSFSSASMCSLNFGKHLSLCSVISPLS